VRQEKECIWAGFWAI